MEAERNALIEKLYQEVLEDIYTTHDCQTDFGTWVLNNGQGAWEEGYRMIYGIGNVLHSHSHIRRVSACVVTNSEEVAELRALINQLTFNMLNMNEQNGHLKAEVESLLRQYHGQMSEDDFLHPNIGF